MFSFKMPVVLILSAILLFTAFMITVTHSEFYCDIETDGQVTQCSDAQIDDEKTLVCGGDVFHIYVASTTKDFVILCPWNFWTIFTNVVGVLIGIIFTIIIICQRKQRKVATKKFVVRLGFFAAGILAISTIVMGVNLSGGSSKCEEFEGKIKGTQADCSVAAFGWDVALMSIGVLLLAFEAGMEYRKYRFGDPTEFEKTDDLMTQDNNDYNARFFEDS